MSILEVGICAALGSTALALAFAYDQWRKRQAALDALDWLSDRRDSAVEAVCKVAELSDTQTDLIKALQDHSKGCGGRRKEAMARYQAVRAGLL